MSFLRILTLAILIILVACKTIPFNPTSHSGDLLVVGEGGGFAGIETSYYITGSGDVYKQVGRDTVIQKLMGIDQQLIDQMFNTVEQLDLLNYAYNNPGNSYKFLELHLDGKSQKLVWTGEGKDMNPSFNRVYSILRRSIKE